MNLEETHFQSDNDRRSSCDLGAQTPSPPTEVPGYELRRFLGKGAYGQVWVALDKTTGRHVAIKFFSHRKALDGSLLSREVEKLVFLSTDRYVVQLLDVGWDAEPPYYVMEYIENGSLDDRIKRDGPLPMADAVSLFREVAIGLSHAHSKGVLHCDLKPANVLLDRHGRPRLADFGQSRLTHEQSPALGTLFYMAPEQADLNAVPDARWDVYALGALFCCMVTGDPPHRTPMALAKIEEYETLSQRLEAYRETIHEAPRSTSFRKVPAIDRSLIEIIDGCLAKHPADRFPHVANVIDAIDRRQRSHFRRPLVLLGLVGPLLLLATMSLFGFRAYDRAVNEAAELVRQGTMTSNRFAVDGEAQIVALEVEKRFHAIATAAEQPLLVKMVTDLLTDVQVKGLLDQLRDPSLDATGRAPAKSAFLAHPLRIKLQDHLDLLIDDPRQPKAASWILTGPVGVMLAASFRPEPTDPPVGNCYAYRSYFHGGPQDLSKDARPNQPLLDTHISTVFRSTATGTAKVAMTTPLLQGDTPIGVIGVTVELGDFVRFATSDNQGALLVDARPGDSQGVVLEHPLFEQFSSANRAIPERFFTYRMPIASLQDDGAQYRDPFANDELASHYEGEWIASSAPVMIRRLSRIDGAESTFDTGLLMIVQARAEKATEPVQHLARQMLKEGMAALLAVVGVTIALWVFVVQMLRSPAAKPHTEQMPPIEGSTVHSRETLEIPFPERR
jgi:hypothetical protein